MKIKKISLKNFRCYKDEQTIEFNTDGLITLIYGHSGAGKSTLSQFINWIFYNKNPNNKTGVLNNKPLYNEVLLEETKNGEIFYVEGQVEFVSNNHEFLLIKKVGFKKQYSNAVRTYEDLYQLNYKNEYGCWVQYTDSIENKINELIPQALSKYFFFSGEENIISENSSDLKKSIYTLFGLTKYENAIFHLGTSVGEYNTVLNKYSKDKASLKPVTATQDPKVYLRNMEICDSRLKTAERNYNYYSNMLKNLDKQIADLTKEIILSSVNPEIEKKKLEQNKQIIKNYEQTINDLKVSLGNILYRNTPYLLLNEKAQITKKVLAENAKAERTFKDLRRSTLEDILSKGVCVCGNHIGKEELDAINNIIHSMPPNSWNFTYNRFVEDNAEKFNISLSKFEEIDSIMSRIVELNFQINELDKEIKEITRKLADSKFDEMKAKGEKLQKLNIEREKVNTKVMEYYSMKEENSKKYTNFSRKYHEVDTYMATKGLFDEKISLVKEIVAIIQDKLRKGISNTKAVLEESIIEVYQKISTRVEDFGEDLRFINDDFSLRQRYKAGGQEVVDVYSYIIGMIKAIKQADDTTEDSEFPVIIDAPFSKTDEIQLKHVIDVIPTIVSQVAMFTFDIERIKSHADTSKIGTIYEIKHNKEQTVSTIIRRETL